MHAFSCHREGMKVSPNSVYHLWLNELRILANVKMWNTAMQIQYIFGMFQTRQGQFIIHHNTWPHPQLLALTLKRCKCLAQSFISQCYFLSLWHLCVLMVLHHVSPVCLLKFLKLQTYILFPMHIANAVCLPQHTYPGMLQAVFHQIMSQTFPQPPLSFCRSHHVAMALHRDIRQTPRIGCRFPSCFHLLLVPKEGNNVVMSFNKLSDPLMEGWQSLPVATNWLKNLLKKELKKLKSGRWA